MDDVARPPDVPRPGPGWFWNPYSQIFFAVILTAVGQIFLKMGANGSAGDDSIASWLGLRELGSGWTWLGTVTLIGSFGSWLYALRFLPLWLAFSLTNGVYIFVSIGSWLFLHEKIGPLRAGGIIIIIAGVVLLAQSVAKAEERV